MCQFQKVSQGMAAWTFTPPSPATSIAEWNPAGMHFRLIQPCATRQASTPKFPCAILSARVEHALRAGYLSVLVLCTSGQLWIWSGRSRVTCFHTVFSERRYCDPKIAAHRYPTRAESLLATGLAVLHPTRGFSAKNALPGDCKRSDRG
jgi:hypothetical protein